MAERHHILLIPGFFGFESLGELRYFGYVKDFIEQSFAEHGAEVSVSEVMTSPTSSIRHRAARVVEAICETVAKHEGPLHLIGHSTGGLDARLAIAPTASLPTDAKLQGHERIESLVTVATPHYGTPTAAFFGSFMGKPLLRTMALGTAYTIRFGRLPLSVGLMLGRLAARADDIVGLDKNVMDIVFGQLLGDFSPERREALITFLTEVAADQSLVFQLTPDGIDLFNATTADPWPVRYGSVITRARQPGIRPALRYRDVYTYSMYGLYSTLYMLAARMPPNRLPLLADQQRRDLLRILGEIPSSRDNDGMVPTLSQVWGSIVHCAEADHFDVVGHFSDRSQTVPHIDWLPSGSGFTRKGFEAVWRDVVAFLLRKSQSISERQRPGTIREVEAVKTGRTRASMRPRRP